MKRFVVTLIAGAIGFLVLAPVAHAQDWRDMYNDENAIRQKQRELRHDRWEQQEDIENGDFSAAAREQEEIDQRRAQLWEQQQDLNRDWANRYYGYDDDGD